VIADLCIHPELLTDVTAALPTIRIVFSVKKDLQTISDRCPFMLVAVLRSLALAHRISACPSLSYKHGEA